MKIANGFFKNILILLSGNAIGQVINILVSPIISRIFTPEAFGVFGVFTSLISILTNTSSLKLEVALPILEDEQEFKELLWVSLFVNIVFSCVVGIILKFLPYSIYQKFDSESLIGYIWLVPVSLMLTGMFRILNCAVVRYKAFKAMSYSYINQIIVKNVVQIGLGYWNPTGVVLITGTVLNQATGMSNLFRVLWKRKILKWDTIWFKRINYHLKKHIDYIIFGTPSGLVNAVGLYLPIPLVIFYYGSKEAGLLSFCITLISLPMRTVGSAVSQAYVGECAEMLRNKKKGLTKLYVSLIKRLSALVFIPICLVLFFGKDMFRLFFGEEWTEAGHFAQILSLPFAMQFISSPLSQILNLLRQQKLQLIWDLIRMVAVVVSLSLPAIIKMDVITTLGYYSVASTLCYILLIWFCYWQVKKSEA